MELEMNKYNDNVKYSESLVLKLFPVLPPFLGLLSPISSNSPKPLYFKINIFVPPTPKLDV